MLLCFPIGKNSNNELVVKDVVSLPHLFVAYTDATQLQSFLQQVTQQIQYWQQQGNIVQLAIALNRSNSPIDNNVSAKAVQTMLYNEAEAQMSNSKDAFVEWLYKEMTDRLKQR
jgi:hypothetical protein